MQSTLSALFIGPGAQRHAQLEEEAGLEWRRAQTARLLLPWSHVPARRVGRPSRRTEWRGRLGQLIDAMDRSVEELGPEPPAWWRRGQPMQLTMATVAEHVAVQEDIAMAAVAEHVAVEEVIASMAAEPAGDERATAGDGAGDDKPAEPCTKRRKTHMPPESRPRQARLDHGAVPPLRKEGTPILLRARAHRPSHPPRKWFSHKTSGIALGHPRSLEPAVVLALADIVLFVPMIILHVPYIRLIVFSKMNWSMSSRKTHNFFGLSFSLSYQARHTNSLDSLSLPYLARHTQIRWLVSCPLRVNLHAVVVQQRHAATRLLCNCQDTGILTPQWPPCTCDLQSTVIACVSVFLCFRRSTRTQFAHASVFTNHRIHSFKQIHRRDRRQLQLFQRLALHDRTASYVCARSRHICSISFCLHVPTERDEYVWLVQSRRRPEKWTRNRKAGSRGSVTPDPVS